MDSQVLEYWKQAHQCQDVTKLTGTSLAGHLDFLNVLSLPKGRILCIGTGNGSWVNEVLAGQLSQELDPVWTLDVVQNDFIGIVSTVDPTSLPPNYFDLALSLWVAPHMEDDGLAEQLHCVIRALTDNGILAIHYNEPLSAEQYVAPACVGTMMAGTVLRTRKRFNDMVEDAGGVSEIVNVQPYPEYNMQMVAAHVRKVHS